MHPLVPGKNILTHRIAQLQLAVTIAVQSGQMPPGTAGIRKNRMISFSEMRGPDGSVRGYLDAGGAITCTGRTANVTSSTIARPRNGRDICIWTHTRGAKYLKVPSSWIATRSSLFVSLDW